MAADWWLNADWLRRPGFPATISGRVEAFHWVAFGSLGIFAACRRSWFLFWAFLSWAFMDELIQAFLPQRIPDIVDVARNVGGFLGGWFGISVYQKIRSNARSRKDGIQ